MGENQEKHALALASQPQIWYTTLVASNSLNPVGKGPRSMPKLEPFDAVGWARGLDFDFTVWGGVKGRVGKGKPAKVVPKVKPSIRELSATPSRTLKEHYQAVRDLTTRENAPASPKYKTPAWPTERRTRPADPEVLQLLMDALKGTATEDDDNDQSDY